MTAISRCFCSNWASLLGLLLVLLDPFHQQEDLVLDLPLFLVCHLDLKEMRLVFLVRLELREAPFEFADVILLGLEIAFLVAALLDQHLNRAGRLVEGLLRVFEWGFCGLDEIGGLALLVFDLHEPEIQCLQLDQR